MIVKILSTAQHTLQTLVAAAEHTTPADAQHKTPADAKHTTAHAKHTTAKAAKHTTAAGHDDACGWGLMTHLQLLCGAQLLAGRVLVLAADTPTCTVC